MFDLLTDTETPRVLIVEDDPVSAMLVQRLFKSHGIAADRAVNGAVAIEMHNRNRYRLVVSDWMMPEMDGVELCTKFRQMDGPYVYYILCSAKGQRADRIAAFDAGVDDFLSKPLDRDELTARLKVARRILATEEALQAKREEVERAADSLSDMNECLTMASRRFEELFNGLPVACFTFDEAGMIHEWNRGAQEVFGIQSHEAFQRPVWNVFSGEDASWDLEQVQGVFHDGEPVVFDWTFTTRTGTMKYLACNVICLRSMSGKPVGAVCANLDITGRKQAEQQIEHQMLKINQYAEQLQEQKIALETMNTKLNHLAVTDGLTGLWNHRRFQEMLDEQLAAIHRTGEPISLILLDIDHFKRFNDDFGHQVGDAVLVQFADTLRVTARSFELPARYGGEEFAIILQGCDLEGARVAAERFRESVEAQRWPHRQVTCSVGITTCYGESVDSKKLVAEADLALYYSKQHGRNRSTHYSQMTPTPATR